MSWFSSTLKHAKYDESRVEYFMILELNHIFLIFLPFIGKRPIIDLRSYFLTLKLILYY
jgi:hypothetical protein